MKFFTLLFSFWFVSFSALADDALNAFIKRLDSVSSMETHFEQVTVDQSGSVLQSISGLLTVARPGKMRWETQPPYEQLVVSDGELVWIYDMDLEQVTIRELEQKLQDTPALLLSGNTSEIGANYTVAMAEQKGLTRFTLTPRDSSQLFEALEFDYEKGRLTMMRIFDAAGQVTEIRFTDLQLNTDLDPQAFWFDLPEGVDVIDGRHAL